MISVHVGKACPAIDGTALARIERHGRQRGTFSAFGVYLDTMAFAGRAGDFDCFETAVLGFFAVFAAFWRILELFIAEKGLLARAPDKILYAIYAGNQKILEFVRGFDSE